MSLNHPTFILFFLLTSCPMVAQNLKISGLVENQLTNPIEFANVFYQHTVESQLQGGTITEVDGTFQLSIPKKGRYSISISYIGFEDWKDTINILQSIDLETITLKNTSKTLKEIEVVSKVKVIERQEDKLIFNVSKSPLKMGFDGMEVLERSPNILVSDDGQILMRNEVATVMINGRITNLTGTDLANYLSNIRSENIQSIQIQNHSGANTDGENSGGVVNIILTKKPIGFNGSWRTDYTDRSKGDYGFYSGLNFNYGANKWNVYGNYNFQKNTTEAEGLYQTTYYELQQFLTEAGGWHNDRERHNYQLGIVSDIAPNQVIGVEFYGSNNLNIYANPTDVHLYQDQQLLANGTANLNGITHNNLYSGTLNYTWQLDTMKSNWKIFADYATQRFSTDANATSTYETGIFSDNSERNNTAAATDIYAIQTDLEKYFLNGIKLETGAKWTLTKRQNNLLSQFNINENWVTNDRSTAFNYNEQVLAGYIAFNKNFGKKTFAEIGLRLENTQLDRLDLVDNSVLSQNYNDWFPSFYISRDLPKDQILSFNYTRRLRRPNFQFLNNYAIKLSDYRFELGNPDLRPEYVHRFSLDWKKNNQTVSAYLIHTNDAINGIYFLEDQVAFYKKFNAGEQQQYGLAYNRFGNIVKWWYIRATLGLYHRRFIEVDGTISFARTSAYLNLTQNFKINATTNFEINGYYYTPYEDAYYIEKERYRFNLMLQKTFLEKKLMVRLYFNDPFDLFLYKNERPFEDFISQYEYKPQSRLIRVRVVYNFASQNKVNRRTNQSKNEARQRL